MLRFFGKLGVLTTVLFGGSYFLGWYKVATTTDDDRTVVQVSIDRVRIREHKTMALQRFDAFVRMLEEKVDSALE